jgi:phosphate/sulfate permease
LKNFLLKLITEAGDDVSMVRVLALACVITGIALAFLGVYMGKELSGLAQVVGVFIGAGMAAKVAQKGFEK